MKKTIPKKNKKQLDFKEIIRSSKFFLEIGLVIVVLIVIPVWAFLNTGEEAPSEPSKPKSEEQVISELEAQKNAIWQKLTPEQQEVLAYVPYSKEAYDLMMKDYSPQLGDDETGGPGTYEDVVKEYRISYLRAVSKIDPSKIRIVSIKKALSVNRFITTSNETITLAGVDVIKADATNLSDFLIVGHEVVLETTGDSSTGYLFYKNGTLLNLELVKDKVAVANSTLESKYTELFNDPYNKNLGN
ncbi:MAG: hypothetical protein M1355_00225 [Patescibacteria group bacterium]|nr:hypothetical protein [Patescibacteria group bacterium]